MIFARLAVDHQRFADDGVVGAELRSPVGRGQHDRFGSRRRVVGLREEPPEHRLHAENRQHAVGHEQGRHFLRLGAAGDADGARIPEPDVLEHAPFFAIGEVLKRCRAGAGEVDAGRRMIERDELLGPRIGQRLEEHALDDAEDCGIRADPEGEGQDRDAREKRHPREATQQLVEAHRDTYGRRRSGFLGSGAFGCSNDSRVSQMQQEKGRKGETLAPSWRGRRPAAAQT